MRILKLFSRRVLIPFDWLLVRLPLEFSIPLLLVAALYFFCFFPAVVQIVIPWILLKIGACVTSMGEFALSQNPNRLARIAAALGVAAVLTLTPIISSLMTILIAVAGIWLSHYVAGHSYRIYRRLFTAPVEVPQPVLPGRVTERAPETTNPLERYRKIGIILSGGGAKGAYQAGAMKAIYEFLEENNAHSKVQMIAATSIGSWNALFWLAGLIKSKNGDAGALEQWWSRVNVKNVIRPITYIPTRQNYFLSNDPWQETFNTIFSNTDAGQRILYHVENPNAPDAIRFYFTRSNIAKANLAFTTNRDDWDSLSANLPNRRPRPVITPGTYRVAKQLGDIRTGVFCSMDIPPLFQYTPIEDEFYEDGGVIDNLPIRFGTEFEECDLLFILPLNASFERKVDQRSVLKRLARVTEIRQGVLERNAFKMIYLYNELASLRKKIDDLEGSLLSAQPKAGGEQPDVKKLSLNKIADRALKRTHDVVQVFSICPAPELKICTTEFWKTREAGEAFQFMYKVTRNELKKFSSLVNSNQIRMVLVRADCGAQNNGTPERVENLNGEDAMADRWIRKTADDQPYEVTYFKDF